MDGWTLMIVPKQPIRRLSKRRSFDDQDQIFLDPGYLNHCARNPTFPCYATTPTCDDVINGGQLEVRTTRTIVVVVFLRHWSEPP